MSAQPSTPSSSPDLMSVAMATLDPGVQREGLGMPALRIGLVGGLTAMLCCVGPTMLATVGMASAARPMHGQRRSTGRSLGRFASSDSSPSPHSSSSPCGDVTGAHSAGFVLRGAACLSSC